MCTAITFKGINNYFGRNLDYEHLYDEKIAITPRNYELNYKKIEKDVSHFAFIGMATVINNYPLYYDGINEYGLGMAGLNFVGNASYNISDKNKKYNITPYEFIPWILSNCKNVCEAKSYIKQMNMINVQFNANVPLAQLHWIIADKDEAITVECMHNNVYVYNNEVGVLTNNPPFEFHMQNLSNYLNITANEATNRFSKDINIKPYSRGMGGIGLPGDLSSASRFIKATFVKYNSEKYNTEEKNVNQFFHLLGAVEQQAGCVKVGDTFEKTQYTSCCNMDKGIYYYRTYNNSQIIGIDMFFEELNSDKLILYPFRDSGEIIFENRFK